MTRPITRKGDRESSHLCFPSPRRQGAFNTVFANGRRVSGAGHLNSIHRFRFGRYCLPHARPLKPSQMSVFAEGRPVGRIGDITCLGPTVVVFVIQGSTNVFVGG